jgi:hypothetical protein
MNKKAEKKRDLVVCEWTCSTCGCDVKWTYHSRVDAENHILVKERLCLKCFLGTKEITENDES